jgi:hypothetical protein
VISFKCCACRYTACACSLSQFFYRGPHGQESEEGKEDREGSHQEDGKEDFKEKEVVVSTTERLLFRVAPRTQSETSPKGYEASFGSRSVSRRGKIRPDLCAGGYCIKVRFFVSAPAGMICSCAKDRCRMAATRLRRGSRESLVRECGRAHFSRFKPWRERSRAYRTTFSRRRAVFLIGATRHDP